MIILAEYTFEEYKKLLLGTTREGMKELLEYMENETDIKTAPASSKYHSNYEGGLVDHSIKVMNCLLEKRNSPIWKEALAQYTDDEMKISALLHDYGKLLLYQKEMRSKKSKDGQWVNIPIYTFDEQMPLTHASKSVILLQQHIKLTENEILSVFYHMGFSEPKETYYTLGNAIAKCPLILALNEADTEATYLLEKTITEDEFIEAEVERLNSKENYIFSFGKYKGEKLLDVLAKDRGYLEWMLNKGDLQKPLDKLLPEVLK